MSKYKTTGNNNFKNNTKHNAKHAPVDGREDNRGFWEGSLFQRGKEKIDEQCIKTDCPTGSFDPYNIPSLMNPKLSREEELLAKRNNNQKLNKTENMIVDIYIEKKIKKVEQDLAKLELHGLNAKPETDEGRIRLLFKTIEYYQSKPSENSNELTYYAFNKIKELNISEKLQTEYSTLITKINDIIEDLDCVKLQFNRFHSNMPPLNERGFVQLDPFQKEVITNIDNNNSIIVQAPTSAGKSILTGYLYTKQNIKKDILNNTLRIIVVVPTDPLAWQMSAYIGKITKKDIPLVTRTFQSDTTREGLINKIKSVGIVVGTPQYLVDYLPLINDIKFDWLVVDEIHMIGKDSCKEMEVIIKAYSDIPIMALSATIGNTEMLKEWFIKLGHNEDKMKIIKCEKRFFNLQKYYYDSNKQNSEDPLVRIHPLSMVSFEDFKTGAILTKTLNATPPDIWDLAIKLDKILPAELKIKKHFKQSDRITLDQANEYFMKLLNWLVENNIKKKKNIEEVLTNYKLENINNSMVDLYNVAMNLKKSNKTPALIFQTDSHLCLELVRKFSKKIREEEELAHPKLLEQRLKEQHRIRNEAKRAKQKMIVEDKKGGGKKSVDINLDKIGDKKMTKLMMTNENFDDVNEKPADVAIYEPHPDFILNNNQQFSQYMVDQWDKQLKAFFPHNGSEYHYMIDLLWRGVGVYCKGLPDPYLHIIQNLACGGKLGLVFSDDSLVFGVSMPFRTTVITPDENINSMMYHQMSGRAGRRGLDKEGNVVLIGYTPDKIYELTSSCIPNVNGCDTMFYGADYGKQLYNDDRWSNIKKNFLLDKISDETASEFYEGIDANLKDAWSFAINDNISFKHMMWRFRHSEDCYRVAFLLSFIRKIYKHSDAKIEKNQIDVAKFLSNYIDIYENDTKNDSLKLEPTEQAIKLNIKEHLETLGLEMPENIDARVYESIRMNKLFETGNRKEKSHLRERLLNFGEKVRNIQHYFFFCEEKNITKLLGKLLTRIWWIYHTSSPVMEPIERYDIQNEDQDEDKIQDMVQDQELETNNNHSYDSDEDEDEDEDE
jgi:superfamily II DNA or RNA helicase